MLSPQYPRIIRAFFILAALICIGLLFAYNEFFLARMSPNPPLSRTTITAIRQSQLSLGVMAVLMFVLATLAYERMKTSGVGFVKRVALMAVSWTVSLCVIEWIGYNVCKIQLNSNYPGLCGMNLMHGPWYLKTYYLTAWALMLTIIGGW